jgi:hypothetical protein
LENLRLSSVRTKVAQEEEEQKALFRWETISETAEPTSGAAAMVQEDEEGLAHENANQQVEHKQQVDHNHFWIAIRYLVGIGRASPIAR